MTFPGSWAACVAASEGVAIPTGQGAGRGWAPHAPVPGRVPALSGQPSSRTSNSHFCADSPACPCPARPLTGAQLPARSCCSLDPTAPWKPGLPTSNAGLPQAAPVAPGAPAGRHGDKPPSSPCSRPGREPSAPPTSLRLLVPARSAHHPHAGGRSSAAQQLSAAREPHVPLNTRNAAAAAKEPNFTFNLNSRVRPGPPQSQA